MGGEITARLAASLLREVANIIPQQHSPRSVVMSCRIHQTEEGQLAHSQISSLSESFCVSVRAAHLQGCEKTKDASTVSYDSIRLWSVKFDSKFVKRLKREHQGYGDTFYIDEIFVKTQGEQTIETLGKVRLDNGRSRLPENVTARSSVLDSTQP